MLVIQRN